MIITMDYCVIGCTCVAVLLYLNTLQAGFAYDDSRAIVKNPDLPPTSPLLDLFYNDFWGTPLTHSGSHKSYRPLCVLTFRLNFFLGELDPWGYHLGNVISHALVTAAFTYVAKVLLQTPLASWCSGLLFASHPIHTEAVAGVVGRADVLACLFFLLTLLCYMDYVKWRDSSRSSSGRMRRWLSASLVMILAAAGMLSKEHALTVLGVCGVYDVFVWHRAKVKDVLTLRILFQKRYRSLLEGLGILAVYTASLLAFRIYFMGNKPPEFAPSDNPAADSDSLLTRCLTFMYLPCVNFWMLLCPRILSFDWSMNAIPLLDGFSDPRNVLTLLFYSMLVFACYKVCQSLDIQVPSRMNVGDDHHNNGVGTSNKSTPNHNNNNNSPYHHNHHNHQKYHHKHTNGSSSISGSTTTTLSNGKSHDVTNGHRHDVTSVVHYRPVEVIILSVAILIFPFLPATNLLFYVGFVVAERILYTPSMGVCLLVGLGTEAVYRHVNTQEKKKAILVAFGLVLVSFGAKTVLRNQDWQTEERLYSSGVAVNPAKAWGNLANIYNGLNRTSDAETAYRNALKHRPNMADVHYNLGILLQNERRFQEAVDSYTSAMGYRPKLTVAYLNLGILRAQLGEPDKAKEMYTRCAALDTAGLKDPRLHDATKISCMFNHGRLLMDSNMNKEALELFQTALSRRPDHYSPQSLYNMIGEVYFKLQDLPQAEKWYMEALASKPDHIPAHLTMAKLHQNKNNLEEALRWFEKAKKINPDDVSVDFHRAQFLSATKRHKEAIEVYTQILPKVGDDFDVIYNAAHAYREHGAKEKAEQLYVKAASLKPKDAIVHMNLGAMYHMNDKLVEAEQSYLAALRIEPGCEVTQQNLKKLRNLMASRNIKR